MFCMYDKEYHERQERFKYHKKRGKKPKNYGKYLSDSSGISLYTFSDRE